jgi:hypothetical protein
MKVSNLMIFRNLGLLPHLMSGNQNLENVMFYHGGNRYNRSRGEENRPLYGI